MSKERRFESEPSELLDVVPAIEYADQIFLQRRSPFVEVSIWTTFLTKILRFWIRLIENLLKTKLYTENEAREFFSIDSRLRTLLVRLIDRGIVGSWERVMTSPDLPPFIRYHVTLNEVVLPSGRTTDINAVGQGMGKTDNEALTIAIAEALERHAVMVIDPHLVTVGSFQQLKRKRAVAPSVFDCYTKEQRKSKNSLGEYNDGTIFSWIKARELQSKESCLIPAQVVNITNLVEYPHEPKLCPHTTNGAAAARSWEEAVYKGIFELVERDAFFVHWMNKLTPNKIALGTVENESFQKILGEYERYGLELHVLDITTDIGIPCFCGVALDKSGGVAVSVSTSAGYDPAHEIERIAYDLFTYVSSHFCVGGSPEMTTERFSQINTFGDRRNFWSHKSMISEIEFMICGEEKPCPSKSEWFTSQSHKKKLALVKERLKKNNLDAYVVDVTTDVAKVEGLHVAKILIPKLIPPFFSEEEACLGLSRLYTVPVTMGYQDKSSTEENLNKTPHPFL